MKINEVEERLSITRANVRYYEKEGLLSPEREANGYRNYSENDIELLRKIIIFRKIGLSVDTIKDILDGEVPLAEVLEENRVELKKQMDSLAGAMEVNRIMERELADAENFDTKRYWDLIQKEEEEGHTFFDYVKDYAVYEEGILEAVLGTSFLYDFRGSRQRHGLKIALVILAVICGVRGLCVQFLWKTGSFLSGFFYPFVIFAIISVISFPMYVLNRKYGAEEAGRTEKAGKKSKFPVLLGILRVLFMVLAMLLVIIGVPVAAERVIYQPLLLTEYGCVNSGLYALYAVTGVGAVSLLYWIVRGRGMGELSCALPKRVKIKAAVYVIVVYLAVLAVYLDWYDCFTEDGAVIRRVFYEKEYTWNQAECFDILSQTDGLLGFVVTMDDGTRLKPLDANSSSCGDNEAFVRYLTQKLIDGGVRCQVGDWDQLRDSLGKYEYWQEYMDELRKITEDR